MSQASPQSRVEVTRHASPHLGAVAAVYVVLKIASVVPVSAFGMPFGVKPPFFPALNAPITQVSNYFAGHAHAVLMCAFLQFGAAIPFGIVTASVVSRFRFFGTKAAGIYIALFGGFLAAQDEVISAAVLWVLSRPVISQAPVFAQALHYLAVALGGPGFTVPQGLLMAGISVVGSFMKVLPKWIVVLGLVLAVTGELSWLSMIFPQAGVLIPLTRWPGFIWLIAMGFALPRSSEQVRGAA
jgi:hypothetical protein